MWPTRHSSSLLTHGGNIRWSKCPCSRPSTHSRLLLVRSSTLALNWCSILNWCTNLTNNQVHYCQQGNFIRLQPDVSKNEVGPLSLCCMWHNYELVEQFSRQCFMDIYFWAKDSRKLCPMFVGSFFILQASAINIKIGTKIEISFARCLARLVLCWFW